MTTQAPAPSIASSAAAGPTRRDALRLLALALAGSAAACSKAEDIVPLTEAPESLISGEPLRFATTLPLGGYGRGMIVTSVDGRPIKVEGNPRHPGSQGATDIFAEAEILSLYDPTRLRTPYKAGRPQSWEAFFSELSPRLDALRARGGEGLAILTGRVTSPTLLRQMEALRRLYPAMRWTRYEPIGDDNARAGARAAFGRPLDLVPHLDRCDLVLTLGADPLGAGPDQIANGSDFRKRRTVRSNARDMMRLYSIESERTLTGAMADHRLALGPEAILDVAWGLADGLDDAGTAPAASPDSRFVEALLADLDAHRGRALVLVGEGQPPELHALAHWMNARLGAFGATVDLVEPSDPIEEDHAASLSALVGDLHRGAVDTLLILSGNPVYDAPADLDFGAALDKAAFSAQLDTLPNETNARTAWRLAGSHPLEAWSDLRFRDGTASVVQPLIKPLYETRTAHDLLALLGGANGSAAYDLVRATWQPAAGAADFEAFWQNALTDGFIAGSASAPVAPPLIAAKPARPPRRESEGLTLLFRPDPTIWDGRYADNAWLQECPKPFSRYTWENVVHLSPEDARLLGIESGDEARLELGGRAIDATCWQDEAQAPGTAAITLGYGRTSASPIGLGLGANAFALRTSDTPWVAPGLRIRRIGGKGAALRTQFTLDADGRDLAPEHPLSALAALAGGEKKEPDSFYPEQPYERVAEEEKPGYAWGMVIDTTLCTGCNACVVACQAENNVPVVGPDEIARGRDMHWLRIDTYEHQEEDELRTVFEPVPCMHCEKAPCEPVCPVGASVHDHEGLNVQVYNRCVGTRFCQANCPYKVRRFNFFGYADGQEYANLGEEPAQARYNPDVTVRPRGVMEKCTYCVQRISSARREAEKENRRIADGEVTPACAGACPTQAIHFGDIGTKTSKVSALRREPQHHVLLEEVGTRPRTTYLSRIRNPNPALRGGSR
ncbi:4Fe-4S dicluster domain-containing protein [Consotaella salsifontis]|uniref:Prokaryotic molybdopterin-containing oxidoreductase family, iron-sulfur binding subunit n=1 Tax=Consotaella salsifontis TaxID=1365950 RepID=A0A1T4PMT3_9HYPH|nr:4Fe-4S dicluster domain-containing protein [Consotaella salsifontis]SJZ92895.1 prokaryotic molybdopterin-containing oxidoreductase family, iron-sulfur binding subunit [Consotaella salsifontis]